MNRKSLAVLDGRFFLHTLLASSEHGRVYRATHSSGHDVAVKLVFDQASFFDELARLYAMEDSPYFCSCLHNYPPRAVSERVIPLEGEAAEVLVGARGGDVGILVLEWIEGMPLVGYFQDADEMEKVDGLIELSLALRDLAQKGLCHGGLNPDNVLLEGDTHELKIVGLGADPAWWSEQDPSCRQRGVSEDVLALGNHFLTAPKGAGHAFHRFKRRCLSARAGNRPGLNEVHEQIKGLRKRHSPRNNLEILFGFFRPLHLMCWLLVIWGASLALNRLMGDGTVPIQQRRAGILDDSSLSNEARLEALRLLYAESEEAQFRALLAKDMAQANSYKRPIVLSEQDAQTPIAVMAFKSNPAVVGRRDVVRVGDWVQIQGRYGYVAKIEFNRMKIVYEDAHSWHVFQRPNFFRGLHFGEEVVIVWENENNLERLLEALADQFKLRYEPAPAEKADGADSPFPIGGRLSGMFQARGGLDAFITELGEAIDVRIEGGALIYQNNAGSLPIYHKLAVVKFEDRPCEILSRMYQSILRVPVKLDPSLNGEKVSITRYNVTWQELLRELDLTYSLAMEDGQFYILLSPGKHRSENF